MNRLPRALITCATAFAFVQVSAAQTPETPGRPAREERRAPEKAEDAGAEKARVVFEGLRFLSEKNVHFHMRAACCVVEGTFDYDPVRIGNAAAALKKMYVSRGFMNASVEVREEPWSKPRLFTFVVSEGERARLGEIRFEGSRGVPAARLAEATRLCLSDEEDGWRDDYDLDHIDYCARRHAKRLLMAEGYLEAKMSDPEVEALKSGLRVTVRVEEGARYRFGRVKVGGVTALLPAQVSEMVGATPGEVADASKVMEGLRRVAEEYYDRGYAQYTYEVTPAFRKPKGHKGDGVVDFRIEVIEGASFTVSSVRFAGNRLKTVDELRGALPLREGDVLSRRRLLDGLERLYQMGVFYRVFDDVLPWDNPGVECEFDEEKGLVAIKITVDESNLLSPE